MKFKWFANIWKSSPQGKWKINVRELMIVVLSIKIETGLMDCIASADGGNWVSYCDKVVSQNSGINKSHHKNGKWENGFINQNRRSERVFIFIWLSIVEHN